MKNDIDSLLDSLETDDVAQKRYILNQLFDEILDQIHEEDKAPENKVVDLKEGNGYIYKLSQDFLTSSSTLEKKETIMKMLEYIEEN